MPHLQEHAAPFLSSSTLFFYVTDLFELSCFPLSLYLAHIYTYYCINQHHNFLVLIHVNYNLEKLRAKRMGHANWVCYIHTKICLFVFFVVVVFSKIVLVAVFVCTPLFKGFWLTSVISVRFGVYTCESFLNTWFWDKPFSVFTGMLAGLPLSLFSYKSVWCSYECMHSWKFTKVAERCKDHGWGATHEYLFLNPA